jgi:hypothetical protein
VKKFFAMLMTVLALIVSANVLVALPAQASSVTSEAPTAKTLLFVEKVAPSTVAPKLVGIGGVKPAWMYVSCYWAMDGAKYCWRYGCSFYERVMLGCYTGWQRVTGWYA